MIKYLLIGALALMASCSTAPKTSAPVSTVIGDLTSPSAVSADVTFIAKQAEPLVSTQARTAIHSAATQLLALTEANVSATEVNVILAKLESAIPAADASYAALLVGAITGYLDRELAVLGDHNPAVVTYATDIANAVLAAGF